MNFTINRLALFSLIVTATALAVTVHLVHAYQVKRNAEDFLEQATRAESAGETEKALQLLELYLGLKPQNGEVRARHALLFSGTAKSPREQHQAVTALESGLGYNPDRLDLRRELARQNVRLRRFDAARAHLLVLLQAQADDAEAERLLGICEERKNRYDEAAQWYAKAAEHEPDNADNYVLQARVLRERLHQTEQADEVVKAMVEAQPRSVPFRVAAARYFMQAGLPEPAEAQAQFLLEELASRDPDVIMLAAQIARAFGDQGLARQRLRLGLEANPGEPRLALGLAWLDVQDGRHADALAMVEPLVKDLPGRAEDLARLGDILVEAGETEKAAGVLERLREIGEAPLAEHLRAYGLVKQGEWGQARFLLEANMAAVRSPARLEQANLLLAQCHEHLGNPDGQLAAYERVVQIDRFGRQANLGRATLLVRAGRLDEAIASYRSLVHQAPEQGPQLVRLLIVRNARMGTKDAAWNEIEQVLARLPEAVRQSADAQIARAELLAAEGKSQDAWDLLEAEAARRPDEVLLWVALAELAESRGQPEAGWSILDQAEKHVKGRVELGLARIHLAARKEPAEARLALRKLEPLLGRYDDADRDRLLKALGDAYAQAADVPDAVRLWERFAKRHPKDLIVRLSLFQAALDRGDDAAVERLLAEIYQLEGEGGPFWSYGDAARLLVRAARGEPVELGVARERAAAAVAQRPNWAGALVVQARIDDLGGNPDKALEGYTRAIELGERQPAVIRRSVDLLFQQGRYPEAQEVLRNLPERELAGAGLGRQAATLTLLNRDGTSAADRKRALELGRQSVADDSQNFRDFLWLGQVAEAAGEPGQAEQLYRRALALADKAPEPWMALILLLARSDPAKAEAALQEARGKLPADVAPSVLAPGFEAIHQKERAREQYEALLAAKPADPDVLARVAGFFARSGQVTRSEEVLRRMLTAPSPNPERTHGWARRHLAMLLAETGNYQKYQEALGLLDQIPSPSAEDQRARAVVLSTRPEHRAQALALMEQAYNDRALPPNERFLLARLHEASGDSLKAISHLTALLKQDERNVEYLAFYVHALLKKGYVQGAETWVAKLEEVAPREFRTVGLRAKLLQQTGKPDEAARLLGAFAQEHPEALGQTAALLETLGLVSAAEQAFRELARRSQGPDRNLALARFLARHRRVDEALRLCDAAWVDCPPEAVAAASLTVLRTGGGTPAHYRAVERRVSAALQQQPASLALARIQAELLDSQGRYPEAMGWYRKVLQGDPNNFQVLNNLAWLLALHDGRGEEALALLRQAVACAGPVADLLDTRAVVHLTLKQASEAVADIEEVTRFSPSATAYFHLAQAQHLAGQRPAAQKALQKAAALGLTKADVHPLERAAYQQLVRDLQEPSA